MFRVPALTTVASLALAAGLILPAALAAPAHAVARDTREAAGSYNFTCLLENGRTIDLGYSRPKRGACKGWLQVYIGGKQVGHINTGGKLGPGDSVSCLAGSGLTLMSLFSAGTPIGWATLAGIAVTGIGCSGH